MNLLRRCWMRWAFRQGSTASAMERLYMLPDPWALNGRHDRFRFQDTARIVRERFGDGLGTILEVGSGEGLQTKYFAPLAKRIVGLEPSVAAVRRARGLGIANAAFHVSTLSDFQDTDQRFDLVTACEVIYYVEDLEAAYRALNRLAAACLVTYHEGKCARLDPYFAERHPWQWITCEHVRWKAVYWFDNSAAGKTAGPLASP